MSSVWMRPQNGLAIQSSVVNSSAATVTGVAGVSGQIIRVYAMVLVIGGTSNITFQDGTTALSGAMPMLANGSIVLDNNGNHWYATSSSNAFNIGNSGSVSVNGTIYYTVG
jgi:hypothetical protein